MLSSKYFLLFATACLYSCQCCAGDPVKGNTSGFWSHGFIIGSLAETGTHGCIWPSHEITIYSGLFSRIKKDRRETKGLSTYDADLFSELEEMTKTHVESANGCKKKIALHYVYPFPLGLGSFHRNRSSYQIVRHSEPSIKFTDTASYSNYKYEFSDDTAPPCHAYKGVRHGYIFHVSRWGLKNKVCTIYLEDKMATEIIESVPEFMDTVSYEHDSERKIPLTSHFGTYYKKEYDEEHKRHSYSIYSEEGCQFAENAALSQSEVSVHYTVDCCSLSFNWHTNRVNKMTIAKPKNEDDVKKKSE